MHISETSIVKINLVLQCLLLLFVIYGGYLAKIRHQYKIHCRILRIATVLQIISIAAIMLPAMLGYIHRGDRNSLFNTAMWIHHILGLLVVALWVYINLVFQGVIKGFVKLAIPMRLAFFLWIIVLMLGIYLYLVTWVL